MNSAFDLDQFVANLQAPGIHKHLNGKLLEVSMTQLKVSYQAIPAFANPMGNLQGGMLCAMLDDAMGLFAYIAHQGHPAATVSMNVSFLRPCQLAEVTVDTYFVRQGRRISNIESVAYQDGKVVGKSSAVFTVV